MPPGSAYIGAAPDGSLLVCPEAEDGVVHIGGTLESEKIKTLESRIAQLEAGNKQLRATLRESLCSSGVLSLVEGIFQSISTVDAADGEFLTVGNASYLAVANYGNGRKVDVMSSIYRHNAATDQFDKVQDIATHVAWDWEFFTVGDNSNYLVVANKQQWQQRQHQFQHLPTKPCHRPV